MKKLKVLVVEDEPMNREIAEIILTSEGHVVEIAENGQEALDMVERTAYDVVLMDVLMPVMDGLEATRRLRENPKTKDLPIIGVSAKASGSDRGAGFDAGCDWYLNKPYKRKDLMQAVRDTLIKRGLMAPEEKILQE